MKKIIALTALTLMFGSAGTAVASVETPAQPHPKPSVSREQYQTMINQCRYVNSVTGRHKCEERVKSSYRIGHKPNPNLDCRTYSSISVCGKLLLSPDQLDCVRDSVRSGLTRRRSEVECYALR
ncbi:MAG: hypothetical protein QOE54_6906 [Streptosporangiaceae bacterium]|jgi:hypothetical protein|nr:hypothetical protein [Streptosporangiaceae bacterium]MDX6434540.1 hypothetical protein [Streptosporangiaceae bacterium]